MSFTLRPFAFMRLTHEALRAGFRSVRAAALAGDLDLARASWTELQQVIAIHKRHEDEAFFPLLDARFDGAVAKAGLRETHAEEAEHEASVDLALHNGDLGALVAKLDAWADDFEAHLADEEAVMMPLTEQVSPTVEGRAAAVRAILDVDWDALSTVHVPYVVRSLHRNKPYGPLRMFVAALQASSGERFGELEPILRASLPTTTVQSLVAHGHLS